MRKIGIITHYYKSNNFGGNLQAYALCKFLIDNGYKVEQICFPFEIEGNNDRNFKDRLKGKTVFTLGKAVFQRLKRVFIINPLKKREDRIYNVKNRREKAFEYFNQTLIPHSNTVYNSKTIKECVNDYDIFITGSDQVWNLNLYNSAYFLTFVPQEKLKIAYGASLAMSKLTDNQKQCIKENLIGYKAISCREASGVDLIKALTPIPVCNVLDPTLLLDISSWENIRQEYILNKKYIFCYFLGSNKKERKIAKEFARKHNLMVVTIPHAGGWIESADCKFGDKRLFDIAPPQFLSLIKNAEYIFTDSFHAVVFSFIYQKQYFVFNREKTGMMSSRIEDVTKLFGTTERFCFDECRQNLSYIERLNDIDYTIENVELKNKKQESKKFLLINLGKNNEQ